MQIVGPDGQPITELPKRQAPEITAESIPEPAAAVPPTLPPPTVEANGSHAAPPQAATAKPVALPTRAPSTTIDALEEEFQRKKKRELEHARMAGANGTTDTQAQQRRTGEKVGRNDLCPCGSGKKYKKCHGIAEN
jgi:preprotein translocase subunit SecA